MTEAKLTEGLELMNQILAEQMKAEEAKAQGLDSAEDLDPFKGIMLEVVADVFSDSIVKLAKAEGIRIAASAMKMHDNDFDMYRDPVDPEVELEAIEWLNEYADFIDPATNPSVLNEESDY